MDKPPLPPNTELHDFLYSAAHDLVCAREHSVLLVEDTAAHAAIIRRGIDAGTWRIEHVTRARTALETFEKNAQRIVLLDLSLPDSDGLKLLAKLKAINPGAPIIVVTATDQVSVSVEAMRSGACDYVVKTDPQQTASRIAESLSRAWRDRLRAAEERLIEQARLLEILDNERANATETVLRTMCAEVNNPLSGVMALAELLLKQGDLNESSRDIVAGLARSAGQLAEAVQKISATPDASVTANRTLEKTEKLE